MKPLLNVSLGGLWAIAIAVGFGALLRHELTPGRATAAESAWPRQSVISLAAGKPTLVMMVHPDCPCSVASMNELAQLTAQYPDRLSCYVVFVPPGATASTDAAQFSQTELWRSAAGTPGVMACVDTDQVAYRCFHAATSGTVLLYDAGGRLQFNGGITGSRGHEGDNDGIDAIESYLSTGKVTCASTPVYGCSLR